MATRWGICSAGHVCNDFVSAVKTLPPSEHQVVAIGARSLESAQQFAQRFSIDKAYGSYQELASDPNVDVVYIGSVDTEHHKLSLLFLNAGKHILIEKPVAVNSKQAKEIFSLAKEKRLFAMEGLWSRFFPVNEKIRQELSAGNLGEVKLFTSDHCIAASHIQRLYDKKMAGGSMLDLGIYPVQYACMVFDHEKPEKIVATGFLHSHSGVDETLCVTLLYKGNRMAVLTSSFVVQGSNTTVISGTRGSITVDNPSHSPVKCCINGKVYEYPLTETTTKWNFRNSAGFAYQASAVRDSLLKGELENPLVTHENSLLVMSIMEEALRQVGVNYDDI